MICGSGIENRSAHTRSFFGSTDSKNDTIYFPGARLSTSKVLGQPISIFTDHDRCSHCVRVIGICFRRWLCDASIRLSKTTDEIPALPTLSSTRNKGQG